MDTYSSGEELVIKIRKPYTITKHRERWTEEEHNRFIEALKLYGRAWQRIEEHIGTKTAIQIRSHAQKFFTKLEKEGLAKGVPVGGALDLEIPPPRPKRKPSTPYPRKTATGAHPTLLLEEDRDGKRSAPVSSFCPGRETFDFVKKPLPEEPCSNKKNSDITKENQVQDQDNCSITFTVVEEAQCTCLSSTNENKKASMVTPRSSCAYREYVINEESKPCNNTTESGITTIANEKLISVDSIENRINISEQRKYDITNPHNNVMIEDKKIEEARPHENFVLPSNSISQMGTIQGHLNPFTNPVGYPTFHCPFTAICYKQDGYRSLFHMPAFSSLVVSTLLQNPPAHEAARYSAAFWPCLNVESSTRHINPTPSMETVAAATVAAATAWWTAQGLLPFCSLHPGFSCPPVSKSVIAAGVVQSTDSEEGVMEDDAGPVEEVHDKPALDTNVNVSSEMKNRNLVDRSSCGSNMPSGSEVEKDVADKTEETKGEELKEYNANQSEYTSCSRIRISGNTIDYWKKVSEEGRLAFQALFSRETLPQSFSSMYDDQNKNFQKKRSENGDDKLEKMGQLELSSHEELLADQRLPKFGLGNGNTKGKGRRTGGFKPYKRFSVEAKLVSNSNSRMLNSSIIECEEDQDPKRVRLEEKKAYYI
ncbi:protein LATE ELONGATED HYPOCOTYL-like [Impatiens glandulifera]|uniref:protein LATE ELONGATED HYPOCOTYL-like n=1 Tax=Impatiens glandulifera TaxID=253017 RepID=UPI001FB0DE70|nr:protein LATE ELONGATED HYPOCOTYL-like [Impatiens glandulifera]XP_047334744.1 protein LATE ELONGATED HYPOCOTYL-like [Impatiens glandulifera]